MKQGRSFAKGVGELPCFTTMILLNFNTLIHELIKISIDYFAIANALFKVVKAYKNWNLTFV